MKVVVCSDERILGGRSVVCAEGPAARVDDMDQTSVFRKVALERMSSPEQLDQLLRFTDSKSWLALAALVALLIFGVAWGSFGQLTTKVSGDGVLVISEGARDVTSPRSGQLRELRVRVGDHVSTGQVIGVIANARPIGQELLQTQVLSPFAGKVAEVKAPPGSLVETGVPLISIRWDIDQMESTLYLPAVQAQDVRPGMDAEISPATVRRQEYGFLRGKVSSVSYDPVTEETLMKTFESTLLVRSLRSTGPVLEIRVALEPEPSTFSGYRWSTRIGPPVRLHGGTICRGEIVTRRQRPLSLVFPYAKESAGLR